MKKLFAIVLAVLTVCATLTISVSATRDLVYSAPKGTPKIDGEMEALWDAAEWTNVDLPYGADEDNYGHSARVKVMWDSLNLYFFAEVTCPSTEEWIDTFEIYIDENNCKESGYNGDDTQTAFWTDGVREGYGTNTRALFVEDCVVNVTPTSFTVETAIPYFELEPVGGETLGLEFMLNIADDVETFVQALRWNADTANGDAAPWQGTMSFGDLVLLAEAPETEPETEPETVAETEPETVAETEAEVVEETIVEETVTTAEVETAPQTFDVTVISVVSAIVSACGYAVTKRRK